MTDEQAALIAAAAWCGARGMATDMILPTAKAMLKTLDDLVWAHTGTSP